MIRNFIFLMLLVMAGNSLAAITYYYPTHSAALAACTAANHAINPAYECTLVSTTEITTFCSPTGGNYKYYGVNAGNNHVGCTAYAACPYPGQTRNTSGVCNCPAGQSVVNGVCAYPACPITGQIRDSSGACVCPPGQLVINGACATPEYDCPNAGTSSTEQRITAFVATSGELFYNKSRTPKARQTAQDGTNFWCDVTVGPPTNCTLEPTGPAGHSSVMTVEFPDSAGKKGAIKVCEYKLTFQGGKGTSSTPGVTNASPVPAPTNPTNTTAEGSKEVKPTVKTQNGPVETTVDETIEKSGEGVEIIGESSVKASDGTITTTTVTKTTTTNADGSKDVRYDTVKTVRKNPVVRQDYDAPSDTYNPRVTEGELTKYDDWRQQHIKPDGSPEYETNGGGVTRTPIVPPESITNGGGGTNGGGTNGGGTTDGNDSQPGEDKPTDHYGLGNYTKGSLSDDGGDSRLTAAKTAYGTKLAAIKTEAKGVLDFTVSGGTAVLPNIHIATIKGQSIDADLNRWSDSLSIIGDVLVFLAYITGLFMILGVKGGGD